MASLLSLIIILLLPIIFIGIGYYWDYKRDRKYFINTLKNCGIGTSKLIAIVSVIVAGESILDPLLPLDKNYGKSYNAERIKAGIPIIEDSWKIAEYNSSDYEEWWMDSVDTDNRPHSTKIIKYSIFGPTTELDYYYNEDAAFRLEVKYNYDTKNLIFSKISTSGTNTILFSGFTKSLPEEIVTPISRKEFNKIIAHWKEPLPLH